MNILVLMGSPNANGNTAFMTEAFAEGARAKGHDVRIINAGSSSIAGCRACEYCHTAGNGNCCVKDDMQEIYPLLDKTDMLVLASPVYYWGFSTQLQAVITRFYAPNILKIKKYALLLSSYSEGVYDAPVSQYKSMVGYFSGENMGIITSADSTNKTQQIKEKCFALGNRL